MVCDLSASFAVSLIQGRFGFIVFKFEYLKCPEYGSVPSSTCSCRLEVAVQEVRDKSLLEIDGYDRREVGIQTLCGGDSTVGQLMLKKQVSKIS